MQRRAIQLTDGRWPLATRSYSAPALVRIVTPVTSSKTMRVACFIYARGRRSSRFVRLGEPVSRVRHCEGAVGRHGRGDPVPLVGGSLLQDGDHVWRGVVRVVRVEQC